MLLLSIKNRSQSAKNQNPGNNPYNHDEVKQYLCTGKTFVFRPERVIFFGFFHNKYFSFRICKNASFIGIKLVLLPRHQQKNTSHNFSGHKRSIQDMGIISVGFLFNRQKQASCKCFFYRVKVCSEVTDPQREKYLYIAGSCSFTSIIPFFVLACTM